jgi:hypothetical protein
MTDSVEYRQPAVIKPGGAEFGREPSPTLHPKERARDAA